jgi:uncharacterized protein with PQ loop repeat
VSPMRLLTVENIPIICTILLEWANVGQLHRMWTEHTAAGQSVPAWISVFAALSLFAFYYHKKGLRVPFYTTLFGVVMNLLVNLTVIYFRFSA